MAISTGIPPSQLQPLYWVSVDPSLAGNLTQNDPALLVGISNVTMGAVAAIQDQPIAINTLAFAQTQFGIGSQIERMINAFLNNNVTQLMYGLWVTEPVAGVAAVGNVTMTHAATSSGTYNLYIAGQLIQIACLTTDTVTSMATNLAAAINATTTLPVTATPAAGVVTLTCKWKGQTGNDIMLLENYLGPNAGQYMPVGMTTTVTAMTGGTAAPSFNNAIVNIAPGNYVNVCIAETDSVSVTAWCTEYGFGPTGRWSYIRQQYGWIYSAHRSANFAASISYGMTNNQPSLSILEIEGNTPSPVWEVAAAYCGRGASALLDDPARPLQTLELVGIVPASLKDRYTDTARNNICQVGLATQKVAPSGQMMITAEMTTYQKNSYGQADTAYRYLTVLSTLKTIIYNQRFLVTSYWPRHKLAPDGTRFGPGQAIVTPTAIKGALVAQARIDEYNGLVADVQWLKNNMLVEIDPTNPNRANVLYPPRLIGQLRVFAALFQFRLLLPQDSGITP